MTDSGSSVQVLFLLHLGTGCRILTILAKLGFPLQHLCALSYISINNIPHTLIHAPDICPHPEE